MMPNQNAFLNLVDISRQRLRALPLTDLEQVWHVSGVSRSVVYQLRAEGDINPRLNTLIAVWDALESLIEDAPGVRYVVTNTVSSYEALEAYGESVFLLCDTYATETLRSGVDLDLMAQDAVFELMEGAPLEEALACVNNDSHRGAPALRQALVDLAQRAQGSTAA
jgi:hypothetical protein